MYERSAIVLERYFENLFNFNKENNLRKNYKNFEKIVEQIREYQLFTQEEETIIKQFDEVALQIQEVQNRQSKLHETNIVLENERDKIFNDLSEDPNIITKKVQKIEAKLEENNDELKALREEYVDLLASFNQRQQERNEYSRKRRKVEMDYLKSVKEVRETFENIEQKDAIAIKKFITIDKEQYKQELIEIMEKNGKNERVPFDSDVIKKAVQARIEIAEKEAELYINIYEKTKKLLDDIENDNVKIARNEKIVRDITIKLNFLAAKKEYIVSFLDNERMTAMNGKDVHQQLMEDACQNFETDMKQVDNLYELLVRETAGKATKKAYKELYNNAYLKEIQDKENSFEKEATGFKSKIGAVISFNYWRIERIKNIYEIFEQEVTEKLERDLSEFQIKEAEKVPEPVPEKKAIKEIYNFKEELDVEEEKYEFIEEERYEFDEDDDEDDEYDEDEFEYDDGEFEIDEFEEDEEDEEEGKFGFDEEDEDEFEDGEDEFEIDEFEEDENNDEEDEDEFDFDEEDENDPEIDLDEEDENDLEIDLDEEEKEPKAMKKMKASKGKHHKEENSEDEGLFTKIFKKNNNASKKM